MSTKRGGKRQRKDWIRGIREEARKLTPSISSSVQALDAGKHYEVRDLIEKYNPETDKVELNFVSNQSLTKKLGLASYQFPTDGVVLKSSQLSKSTGEMIDGSDIKILKMSDKTLLQRGNPFKENILKRSTSVSKRVKIDSDAPLLIENPNKVPNMTLEEFNRANKPKLVGRTSKKKGTRLI